MHVIDADALTRGNLAYREPALYDELIADTTLAADLIALTADHNPTARTVLDLGCGTARLLAELNALGLTGTGIDIQPDLVAWARQARPGISLDVADLRTARLHATFDLVVCVGNTLSYLRTDDELAAAFDTIAAHSHPGTLLALATLTGAGRDTHGSSRIDTSLGAATVDTASAWDPATRILTSTRTWRFADGRIERDLVHRRYWDLDTLTTLARSAGFDILPAPGTELSLCAVRCR